MYTVFATYRNIDMTEDKGPMVLDRVFSYEEHAHAYINQQEGVMGRKPSHFGQTNWDEMGDWKVKPLVVFDHLDDGEDYARKLAFKRAQSKLRPEEMAAVEFYVHERLMVDNQPATSS